MCMLDRDVMARVEAIVGEKIGRGERFTAYDVTLQLRAERFWVKHEHVRTEVHALFRDGKMRGYGRVLAPKGGPVPAWEYGPAGAGFPALGGRAARRLVQSHILNYLAPSNARRYGAGAAGGGGAASGAGASVRLDGRATVCVPARFVRQAALRPGDRVQVFIDAGNARLVVHPAASGSGPLGLPARRYTVDRHFNIRIACGTQARAGLQGP